MLKVINSTFIYYRELRTCFQAKDGVGNRKAEWDSRAITVLAAMISKVPKEKGTLGQESRHES